MITYGNGEPYPEKEILRDFKAIAPARVAILLYWQEYREFPYGIMRFWDQLDDYRKGVCQSNAQMIKNSPMVEPCSKD